MLTKISQNPYVRLGRLDKPAGFLFLAFPCLWGCALGPISYEKLQWIFLFLAGAFFLRSAGCVINDLFDADIDVHVKRTQDRPLAQGELSRKKAFIFLSVLLFLGLLIFFKLSPLAQRVSLCAFTVAVVYPLAKRFFILPQLILGLAFNSGVLVAVAQLSPPLFWSAVPWLLYLAGIFWTLTYDTFYAMQDRMDDRRLGLHSSAILFGHNLKVALMCFCVCAYGCIFAVGYFLQKSGVYFVFAGVFMLENLSNIHKMDMGDPFEEEMSNELRLLLKDTTPLWDHVFKKSLWFGLGVLLLML